MKRKNIIGFVGLLVLAFFMFWGVVFSSMGNFVFASLWTIGCFIVLVGLLVLSSKGREKEGAFVRVWNIGGWVGIALYVILSFVIVMPKFLHFFTVNERKTEIQQLISQELMQTDQLFQDYKKQALARAEQLRDNLESKDMTSSGAKDLDSVFSNQCSMRRSGNWYDAQKDALQERLLKPEFETHFNNWSANRENFKKEIAEGWLFITVTQNVTILHNNIQKTKQDLGAFYNKPIHDYERKYPNENGYVFKYNQAQLQDIIESNFTSYEFVFLGFILFFIAFILSCFPFIFVRVSHVKPVGSMKDREGVYKEGFKL